MESTFTLPVKLNCATKINILTPKKDESYTKPNRFEHNQERRGVYNGRKRTLKESRL